MMSNEREMETEIFNLRKIRFGRQGMARIDWDINPYKIFAETQESTKEDYQPNEIKETDLELTKK